MSDDLTRLDFHAMEMTLFDGTVIPIHSVRDEDGRSLDLGRLPTWSGPLDIIAGPAPNGQMLDFTIRLSQLN